MQNFNFNQHITQLLKADNRLVDEENDIQINVLRDLVNNLDSQLIELLIADDKVREKFFIKVKDVYVFKQNDFIFYLDSKVLDGSYTQYANRIGLASGGKFLTDSTDYVLDFPYKDCILEGGQSTEEGNDVYFEFDTDANDYVEKKAKRKEIFYNNIIAKDEIDRLLEPKAFQKVVRYDANGETIPTSFTRDAELNRQRGLSEDTITDNLIIKGNNLLALHSLEKEFKGKVKLIYIDPPYNTGSDSFAYNDKFNHSTWLTFMYNRLEIAKKLLSEEGAIYVHIDYIEYAYLKIILDNIFGRTNFIQTISVKTSTPSGVKVVNPGPVNVTEFVLVYSNNRSQIKHKRLRLKSKYLKDYSKYIVNIEDDCSQWKIKSVKEECLRINNIIEKDLIDKFGKNIANKIISDLIEKFSLENAEKIFATFGANKPSTTLKEYIIKSKSEPTKIFKIERDDKENHYLLNGRLLAFYSSKIYEVDNEMVPTTILTDFWDDLSWDSVSFEGGISFPNGKKPENFIRRIIELGSDENDIVLDYHLGSGTTAAVAHKMNRQYIGIEQLNYLDNDSYMRLKNVVNGENSGISKLLNWKGGGSFIYAELAKNNETAKEYIEACNSLEELLQLFEELNTRYFLDYNVRIKDFKENVVKEEAFINLSLARQKELFKRMLDNNQLYVNLSEVEDARYKLSEDAIRLTKDFYQIKN